jgi:hypothetical protein
VLHNLCVSPAVASTPTPRSPIQLRSAAHAAIATNNGGPQGEFDGPYADEKRPKTRRRTRSNCTETVFSTSRKRLAIWLKIKPLSAYRYSIAALTKLRAQRNAIESPHLRLPPELRSKIWTLVVKVDRVEIHSRPFHCNRKQHPAHLRGVAVFLNRLGETVHKHFNGGTS